MSEHNYWEPEASDVLVLASTAPLQCPTCGNETSQFSRCYTCGCMVCCARTEMEVDVLAGNSKFTYKSPHPECLNCMVIRNNTDEPLSACDPPQFPDAARSE